MISAEEVWREVVGFPKYRVSNFGRVQGPRTMLTPEVMPNGYCRVNLYRTEDGSKLTPKLVHILVAEAFIGPKPSTEHEVAHWDGDKQNNVETNLRWATSLENASDNERLGVGSVGSSNGNAILTESQVREIRAIVPYPGYRADVCLRYGLRNEGYVSMVRSGRYSWSHLK